MLFYSASLSSGTITKNSLIKHKSFEIKDIWIQKQKFPILNFEVKTR